MMFHFEASLPAQRAFLDPLRELLRQAFAYVGYPELQRVGVCDGLIRE